MREWLVDNTGYVSSLDDHKDIPDFLRLYGPFDSSKNMKIASDLELLKKVRHQADYYLRKDDVLRYNQVWVDMSFEEALNIADDIFVSFDKKNH